MGCTSDTRPPSRWRTDSLPLTDLLPYLECGCVHDFEPLHLLADGALGFALEFDLPIVETEVRAEEVVAGLIDQALRLLPEGVQWQWIVQSNSFVEESLRTYLTQTGRDTVSQACASSYVKRWRDAQCLGFFPQEPAINFFPRSQSILLALKSAPLLAPKVSFTSLFRNTDHAATAFAAFVDTARNFQALLKSWGVGARAVDSDRLANFVVDLLFPWRRFDRPPVSTALHSAREAIASVGYIDQVHLRGFRTISADKEAHHRVVSMLWHPHAVRPGMLNDIMLLRPHLTTSLTCRALPHSSTTFHLKTQGLFNARSATRFNEIETQARAEALGEVEQRLFKDGERLIEGRLQVHLIEATAEDAEDSARLACNYLRDFDIEAAPENDIGSSLILRGCLPFTVNEIAERKLRRRRRFLSKDFAEMHPAGGCWKGASLDSGHSAPGPTAMYSNSIGEVLLLDPSKADRNPHTLVVGQSGSGKSFFVHDYLLHLWRMPDIRLYLISIKPDYRKLALLLGRYVELTLDTTDSLNPFAGAPTLENQARWLAALSLMISEGHQGHLVPREHQIALQDSALAASARNWDVARNRSIRETILEDVCLELERRAGPLGRDLAFQLLPYRRGPFRRLFNGIRTFAATDRFVFFNLGNILRQPCSAAVSFCIFNLIDQVMHDPSLRAIPKGLIADEVWAIVQDPFAAAILERSLKAYRSLGGFALPIVQDPRDLDTPAGRAILVNTATKVILPMDQSGQAEISRFVRLNERELELVRNLRLVKRRYSEFFVSIEGTCSAKGRIIPDPLRYAISTTDPADEAELDRLYRDTGDMLQTVCRFATAMPYGIRVHEGTVPARGLARWALLVTILVTSLLVCVLVWSRHTMRGALPLGSSLQSVSPEVAATRAADLLALTPAVHPDSSVSSLSDSPLVRPLDESLSSVQRGSQVDFNHGSQAPNSHLKQTKPPQGQHPGPARSVSPAPPEGARSPASRSASSSAPGQSASIPDQIEEATLSGDALERMSLQARLLTASPSISPCVLLELRTDDTGLQARLARMANPKDFGAWYEPGDSPVSGWLLVRVNPDFATLMSPLGTLVTLTVLQQEPE